jgi:hypothetical protein
MNKKNRNIAVFFIQFFTILELSRYGQRIQDVYRFQVAGMVSSILDKLIASPRYRCKPGRRCRYWYQPRRSLCSSIISG